MGARICQNRHILAPVVFVLSISHRTLVWDFSKLHYPKAIGTISISRKNAFYKMYPILRSIVLNVQEQCTKYYVQLYSTFSTILWKRISTVCFTVLMLLLIVTDTFVLQMVKLVLRNDTFNIAGWSWWTERRKTSTPSASLVPPVSGGQSAGAVIFCCNRLFPWDRWEYPIGGEGVDKLSAHSCRNEVCDPFSASVKQERE